MTCIARQPLSSRIAHPLLAVILLISLALHFNHLGHAAIKDLDEGYHAIVARSMLSDPLTPTLYATPYLPYDYRDWHSNHVWLHKPPVALWQIAGSFAVFGESNFSLRLPSALLATAAVALTFLIGRSLFTVEAGLIAALLQSLSPAITRLVHGQVFSDHVDIAMLFWCEVAIVLLIRASRSGGSSDAALVGIAQAVAWMTKSYPALFIAGLVMLLCIARRWLRDDHEPVRLRISPKQLAIFFLAMILTAAPWVAWCVIHFPREFAYEQLGIVQHLYKNVEQFAAPWDRLLADYLQRGFIEWFALVIVAIIAVSIDAIRLRDSRHLFLAAWAWGILLPHLLATSKTPTATLIGWPAGWIAVGVLVSDALRDRRFAMGALLAAATLLIFWPQLPRESVMGYGTKYRFGSILLHQWPIFVSVILIALVGVISTRIRIGLHGIVMHTVWLWAVGSLVLIPFVNHVRLAIRTSNDVPQDALAFPQLGKFVRAKSPANAVFLVDNQSRGEHIVAMWWLDRTCYPLDDATLDADVATILANGGEPFILSRRTRPELELPGVAGEAKIFVPLSSATIAPTPRWTTRP